MWFKNKLINEKKIRQGLAGYQNTTDMFNSLYKTYFSNTCSFCKFHYTKVPNGSFDVNFQEVGQAGNQNIVGVFIAHIKAIAMSICFL